MVNYFANNKVLTLINKKRQDQFIILKIKVLIKVISKASTLKRTTHNLIVWSFFKV